MAWAKSDRPATRPSAYTLRPVDVWTLADSIPDLLIAGVVIGAFVVLLLILWDEWWSRH